MFIPKFVVAVVMGIELRYPIISLAKGGYVFGYIGLFVCPSVCLLVDNITQKVMNGLGWNLMEGS